MMTTNEQTPVFNSLAELRTKKAALRKDIQQDDQTIRVLWNEMFRAPAVSPSTPSQRLTGLLNTGGSIPDGLILGWKLYRRFSGFGIFGRRR